MKVKYLNTVSRRYLEFIGGHTQSYFRIFLSSKYFTELVLETFQTTAPLHSCEKPVHFRGTLEPT